MLCNLFMDWLFSFSNAEVLSTSPCTAQHTLCCLACLFVSFVLGITCHGSGLSGRALSVFRVGF